MAAVLGTCTIPRRTVHISHSLHPCSEAVAKVIAACQEGVKVVDLCQLGDNTIKE
jgi:hypothetical protein